MAAIEKRYAKAIFELAKEAGELERVTEELGQFSDALKQSAELGNVLSSPGLPMEQRQDVLQALLTKAGASKTTTNTLRLLTERGRLGALDAIVAAVRERADTEGGRVRARVRTATPLQPNQVAAIAKGLAVVTQREVEVDVDLDPSLIGGVVAEIGSVVYDGSIKSQLRRLKESLLAERA